MPHAARRNFQIENMPAIPGKHKSMWVCAVCLNIRPRHTQCGIFFNNMVVHFHSPCVCVVAYSTAFHPTRYIHVRHLSIFAVMPHYFPLAPYVCVYGICLTSSTTRHACSVCVCVCLCRWWWCARAWRPMLTQPLRRSARQKAKPRTRFI